jgi:hypothetical protein
VNHSLSQSCGIKHTFLHNVRHLQSYQPTASHMLGYGFCNKFHAHQQRELLSGMWYTEKCSSSAQHVSWHKFMSTFDNSFVTVRLYSLKFKSSCDLAYTKLR